MHIFNTKHECISNAANPCPLLSAPTNGRVTSTDGSTGDERVYSCLSGYTLAGSSATTCLTTGLWSSPQPVCNGKHFHSVLLCISYMCVWLYGYGHCHLQQMI